jgi:hypothetical protein
LKAPDLRATACGFRAEVVAMEMVVMMTMVMVMVLGRVPLWTATPSVDGPLCTQVVLRVLDCYLEEVQYNSL